MGTPHQLDSPTRVQDIDVLALQATRAAEDVAFSGSSGRTHLKDFLEYRTKIQEGKSLERLG